MLGEIRRNNHWTHSLGKSQFSARLVILLYIEGLGGFFFFLKNVLFDLCDLSDSLYIFSSVVFFLYNAAFLFYFLMVFISFV